MDIELMRAFYETYFDARSNPKCETERERFTSYFLTFPGAVVDVPTKRLQDDGFPLLDGRRRTGDGSHESMVADPEGNRIVIAE